MDEHYEDSYYRTQKASDKDWFLKLPRYQTNLKYNLYGLYTHNTKIANLNLPGRTIMKSGT